ncbi:MAG TPA: LD-carboxypeptidase [Paraburkholderia sp.]|jgi:muramoyltetrapeptide carboxypeptidase|nr:LD-carboxypeptidase [Paraburkholderia sp.]
MQLQEQTVGVIAPAGIPDMQRVAQGIDLLESWGATVRVGAHVRDTFRYLAGTHDARRADLLWALNDPSIDIVWVARGGYGCVHCLPALPDALPRAKTIVGFSDATSLFCGLERFANARRIHGPSLGSLAAHVDEASRQRVLSELSGAPLAPLALQRLAGSDAPVSGRLHGGNLTTLASVAGTRWQPDCRGAIVLLEDITELAYRLDRSLTLLIESGTFTGARAFVLGEFVRCPLPPNADFTLQQMLVDLLQPLGVPVFAGLPIGHGEQNYAWTYGAAARIENDQLLTGA